MPLPAATRHKLQRMRESRVADILNYISVIRASTPQAPATHPHAPADRSSARSWPPGHTPAWYTTSAASPTDSDAATIARIGAPVTMAVIIAYSAISVATPAPANRSDSRPDPWPADKNPIATAPTAANAMP